MDHHAIAERMNKPVSEGFDLDAPWRLHAQVAVRPERFGALLYHFGTRRLSFCKNITLAGVIGSLADHPTARSACTAAGIRHADLPRYRAALLALAESGTIVPRGSGKEESSGQ